MNIFDRIGIGTAAWGKSYRGRQTSLDEVKRILEYCQSCGISFIDSAVAYDNEEAMKLINNSFHVQCKVLDETRPEWGDSFISHDGVFRGDGVSIYPGEFHLCRQGDVVQIPYSVMDRRFHNIFGGRAILQARSVFCGGAVFKYRPLTDYCSKIGLPVGTVCIDFVLRNPLIDKCIVGVDNVEQLKENLRYFHRIESMECYDLNVIDTRRYSDDEES